MYSRTPKFNTCNYPRNALIVKVFGMCIHTKFVKYLLKEIWLQMKFGEIFWVEVNIDALKGEWDKS